MNKKDMLQDGIMELMKAMENTVDEAMPARIADIVKSHSQIAAIAAVASGWVPGIGGTAAALLSAGCVWTMYGLINRELGLSLSESVLKGVASAVPVNLASYVIGGIAISTALSFVPGLGNVGASVVVGGICYALTLASGFVYLKILTKIFKAKMDPSTLALEDLQKVAQDVVKNENIKAVIEEARGAYRVARERGEIQ